MKAATAQKASAVARYFTDHGWNKHFAPGETIIYAHELPASVFLLKSGLVKAYSIDRSGNQHLHMIFTPGKCFPLMRTLRNTSNQLFCVAKGQVELLAVSAQEFLVAIDSKPELLRELLDEAVSQFALFTNRIENLQYSSARERLLFRLLSLAGSIGDGDSNTRSISAEISHDELAASIQVSREVVTRQMRTLKQKHVIDYTRHQIIVKPKLLLKELRDGSLDLASFSIT